MIIKKHIPNILTLLNLFSGCVAILYIAQFKFDFAFYAVCMGIFFDFFDGFFARKFGVSGPLGVQLDSLADMVTCGVAPGMVMVLLFNGEYTFSAINGYLPYFGFVITLASCFRLAKFNIDTRQSDSFIGLPTPANALFIMSLPFFVDSAISDALFNTYTLIIITVLSAYVMNAELPLFSLKIKNFSVQKYKLQLGFLLLSLILLILLQVKAVPIIIVLYVFISMVNAVFSKK
jgi:CDP-diacylglycerol--serine O-phosphatidyltransferase